MKSDSKGTGTVYYNKPFAAGLPVSSFLAAHSCGLSPAGRVCQPLTPAVVIKKKQVNR